VALASGTRLGPYEVLSTLGAGGMGEVYRARDTRLEREVAIKVLPAEVAGDASRLKRFEKEARSASALNHPNIVTIYDIGQMDSVSWIAMELVAGKTLREVLADGALPVKRLLQIAPQIADGLAKAHEAGIVHRDLKPENVMVTKDGLVKILDFGLAKLSQPEADEEGSLAPTLTRGTEPGVVMGTVGYMSPEQASAKAVDYRSDQFSFGAILYEMATGRRAFQRDTAVQTLSAIVQDEPEPITTVNSRIPTPFVWIVERCLAKDPRERYASTRDLERNLATVRDRLTGASAPIASTREISGRSVLRGFLTWLLPAAALLLGVLGGKAVWRRPLPRFQQLTFHRGGILEARFAPDEQTVVYTARWEGKVPETFTTRLDSTQFRSLRLPPACVLSISAAGEMLLLLGDFQGMGTQARMGVLAQVPLAGGAPRELLENVEDAEWSPDGKSFAVVREVEERNRVEYPAGHVLYETKLGYLRVRVSSGNRVAVQDEDSLLLLGGGSPRSLASGSNINGWAWSALGDEIWFVDQRVPGTSELRAVDLAGKERSLYALAGDYWLQDVSRVGRVLLERVTNRAEIHGIFPGELRERDLSWLDQSVAADLSADGTTLLFGEQGFGGGSAGSVYLRRTDGSDPKRLGDGAALALSPDEKWALTLGPSDQYVLLPTGAGQPRALEKGPVGGYPAGWFPDGKRIWFNAGPTGTARCYSQDIEGGPPRPILPDGLRCRVISPDGKRMVVVRKNQGLAIYSFEQAELRPLDGLPKVAPMNQAGEPIRWSGDGRAIFLHGEGRANPELFRFDLASGRNERWKAFPQIDSEGLRSILVSTDGKSIVYSFQPRLADLYLVVGLR
jgi:hypothetical protein